MRKTTLNALTVAMGCSFVGGCGGASDKHETLFRELLLTQIKMMDLVANIHDSHSEAAAIPKLDRLYRRRSQLKSTFDTIPAQTKKRLAEKHKALVISARNKELNQNARIIESKWPSYNVLKYCLE